MDRMADLLDVAAQWVTLRAQTEDGLPVVVLVDQAVATTAPYAEHPAQVAVGVPFAADDVGMREWTFYGRAGAWAEPLRESGVSVLVTDDPSYQGLRELSGLV